MSRTSFIHSCKQTAHQSPICSLLLFLTVTTVLQAGILEWVVMPSSRDILDPRISSDGKASACNAGDVGSIRGSGRSPGEGNSNPLQYSSLENPMDGGAW